MGQKVNPHGLRVGIIKDWDSKWYADTKNGEFANNLVEDHKIREFLKKKLYDSNVSKIDIERTRDRVKISLFTAKPGIIIGKMINGTIENCVVSGSVADGTPVGGIVGLMDNGNISKCPNGSFG